jgi:hypothetical protein
MIFTLGLIGMFIVVALCRNPNVGYWKAFSIKHRGCRLTRTGSELYVSSLCMLAVGTLVWLSSRNENSPTSIVSAEKSGVSDVVKSTPGVPVQQPIAASNVIVQPAASTSVDAPTKITKSIQAGAQFQCITSTLNVDHNPDFQPMKQLWDVALAPSTGLMRVALASVSSSDDSSLLMYHTSIATIDLVRGTNSGGMVATLNPQSGAFELALDGAVGMRGSCDRTM